MKQIRASNITVFCNHREILRNVSFSLVGGEILGIIGPPGCGKTTLLKALAGLIAPDTGQWIVDGNPLDARDGQKQLAWQKRLGMSFQNNALFDQMTVFDNTAFPLRRRRVNEDAIMQAVQKRLCEVGLWEAQDKLPESLSGGMQKRLGLARATIHEPEIGLFDDPIAGLDPVSAKLILDLLVNLAHTNHMAAVVATNDLDVLLPICQRVIMLCEGQIVYDGPSHEIENSVRPEVFQFVRGNDQGPL